MIRPPHAPEGVRSAFGYASDLTPGALFRFVGGARWHVARASVDFDPLDEVEYVRRPTKKEKAELLRSTPSKTLTPSERESHDRE